MDSYTKLSEPSKRNTLSTEADQKINLLIVKNCAKKLYPPIRTA